MCCGLVGAVALSASADAKQLCNAAISYESLQACPSVPQQRAAWPGPKLLWFGPETLPRDHDSVCDSKVSRLH